jgi:exodeoxyribonuclease VII small subunit
MQGTPISDNPIPADITELSFEQALAELDAVVKRLEDGKGKLDDAIASYERGTYLRRHCEAKLAEAQARIDRILVGTDGTITAEPFDA